MFYHECKYEIRGLNSEWNILPDFHFIGTRLYYLTLLLMTLTAAESSKPSITTCLCGKSLSPTHK